MTQHRSVPGQRSVLDTYLDATRAELSKLWTLPATWLTIAGTGALTVLFSFLFAAEAEQTGGGSVTDVNILDIGVAALGWSQVGFFLLGVLSATSEYFGGQVRVTLTAIPNRLVQRVAAATALALLTFIAALVVVTAGMAVVLLRSGTPPVPIDVMLAVRIIANAAGYLTCMALLSSGLGLLIRRAIPGAAILLVYLLIVSPLLQGKGWYFLPDMASYCLWYATVPPDAPPYLTCWLIVLGWTAAIAGPATAVFAWRDA
ncbi:ABC transporter permease [Tsukamurella tyrosinosolvens]|nr:ABC transporter permease [Tsukamurella tyrosinosolvens]